MPLPAEQLEQRDRLLAELARLISLVGYGDFLFGPILLPDPKHFPDEWRPDLAGARAMLARLMAFARLATIPTLLREGADPTWVTDDGDDYVPPHHDAAAWFAGANEYGTYLFGVRQSQLEDAMSLVGILAHETAHAWRFRRDVMESSAAVEERLTDLTTVFLGFGVLTANIASLANLDLQRQGYLNTFALSFALGVQLALRPDEDERRKVEAALSVDQRAIVREIRELYAVDRAALAARLGLPKEAEWERPRALTLPPAAKLPAAHRAGRDIVFRLSAPPWRLFGLLSAVTGALVAMAAMSWWPMVLPVLATPLAFIVKRDRCSGSDCGSLLPATAVVCPSCRGRVVGRIGRNENHDEAEKRFLSGDEGLSVQARDLAREMLRPK